MDRVITIRSKTETLNSRGDTIPAAPTTFATVWAAYENLVGTEGQVAGQKAFASASGRWKIHYRAGVLTTMEVVEGSVVHDIVHIDDSRKRKGDLFLYTTLRAA